MKGYYVPDVCLIFCVNINIYRLIKIAIRNIEIILYLL